MALKTKKEFVQEVLYEVYGGMPPSDARISERFVLTKLNDVIANNALINAYANTNLEGVTYADDVFYVRFNAVAVTADAPTGYRVATLPSIPVGLPSQRSISVTPAVPTTGEQQAMIKMIGRNEVHLLHSGKPIKKVFSWIEGDKIFFYLNKKVFPLLTLNSINLVLATADGGMDSTINMPQDMLTTAKAKIIAELRGSLQIPQDIKNDGQEIKEVQA